MKKYIETLLLQNNINEAKNIIFKEINSNPNVEPELYALLGSAYAIEKNKQLAMQYFNIAYELAPNNFEVVTTISNFLIANGDPKSAMIFMERLAATVAPSEPTVTASSTNPQQENQQLEMLCSGNENSKNDSNRNDDFDYMDFIIGGGDALNYEHKPAEEKQKNYKQTEIKSAELKPAQQKGFSYSELIINDDINDVLEKYNLPKLKNKEQTQNTVSNTVENFNIVREVDTVRKFNTVEEINTVEKIDTVGNFNTVEGFDTSEEVEIIEEGYTTEELLDALMYRKPLPKRNKIVRKKVKPKMLFTMFGWNESGGGTVLPRAVITEFAKRGYEVAVFYAAATKHYSENAPYFMEKNIDDGVKLYGIYNRPTIFLDADNPLREVCDAQIISLFNSVLDEFQPNIINFHNFLGLSFEMATVAKSRNIVSTFTTHNYHLLDPKLYIYNNDLVSWKSTDFFENSDLPLRYPMLKDAYKSRIAKAKSLLLDEIDYTFAVSNRVKELLSDFCEIDFDADENRICVINQIHSSLKPLTD